MDPTLERTRGANAERTRSHNRRLVLSRVRAAEGIGRAEIARTTGLSTQAVSNIIADLTEDGMLRELGRRSTARGQPPVQYALEPGARAALGIELRPDALFAALVDLGGAVRFSDRVRLDSTAPDHVLRDVQRLHDRALAATGLPRERLLGSGVVMPGPFGTCAESLPGYDLPLWRGLDARQLFADTLGCPIIVENDANAAAMAERLTGVARGIDSYLYLYFGRGLGLGVVQQGRLMRGAFGNAGEAGRMRLSGGQTLEDRVSRFSVQAALSYAGADAATTEDLARFHAAANPALSLWTTQAALALTEAALTLENLFDPQTVILGGAMPDSLLDDLIAQVTLPATSVSHRPDRDWPRLMRGHSGPRAATIGAAALVIDQSFLPQFAVDP